MSHLPTVQSIYEDFGRGDVAAILSRLSDDVEWEYGNAESGVPWLKPRSGPAEVAKFFESLAAVEFTRFEPTVMLENGPIVVVLLDVALTVRATGRTVAEAHEVHLWTFGEQGRVTRFTHKTDTHQHWLAFTGG